MKLGMLKRIDLREYWKHEARDFTKWLSEPANIALLSDEVGIGIEVTQTKTAASSLQPLNFGGLLLSRGCGAPF
ncbi:MAG: hypothetical protein Q7J98_00525 [Kiritimatiellia bacterium]|nr:hypothetical protein [Kiritimatiellia bacterium]